MNLKNFLKTLLMLAVVTILVSSATFATTWYVDNNVGLDSYDGLHQTVTGVPGQGPKRTITNAITASSAGDVISVNAFNPYTETITVTKNLVFQTTNGQVVVNSFVMNNTAASPNNTVTFSGAYKFTGGVVLTAGSLIGGGNVTVATSLAFQNGAAVDAQLLFSGAVNFSYTATAAATTTTGFELPAAGDNASLGNLNTDANTTLKLGHGEIVNGTLTTLNALNLNGNTLTIVAGANAGVTHSVGGDVTNGTISFNLSGGNAGATQTVNQSAVSKLPVITVSNTSSNVENLVVNTTSTVGNVTTSGNLINVTLGSATSTGDLTNGTSGDGTNGLLTVSTATTVGNVSNTSTGGITLTAATTITTISNSGMVGLAAGGAPLGANTGVIKVNAAGVTVGNVTLSSVVSSATQGGGIINFNGAGVTVNGNVWNNLNQTVNISAGAAITQQNLGNINFTANGAVTVNGNVTNNAILGGSIATTAAVAAAFQLNGWINFQATTGVVTITGALTNSSSAASLTKTVFTGSTVTYDQNGVINIASTGAANSLAAIANSSNFASGATNSGTIVFANNGSNVTVASVSNSSSSATASNGVINFGTGAGTVTVSGAVSSTGAAGGPTQFPNSNFSAASISNQRTAAGGDIIIGTAATAATTVTTSGDVVNSGAANVTFKSSQTGNIVIGGQLANQGGGTISFPGLTTGTISVNNLNISNGKIDFSGAGAAASGAINSGNVNLTAGTIDFGTAVARSVTISGSSNVIGSATGQPTFSNGTGTTLTFAAPTPTVLQSLTVGAAGVVWPGNFTVNNTTGLAEAFDLFGGNFRAWGNVTFTAGVVAIRGTNQRLFVGDFVNSKTGNFTNASGYTAFNNSFVSINGFGASTVSGAGIFSNLEVDAAAGAAVSGTFNGIFGLANGSVTGGAAIIFNNATTFPTIVRNNGTFAVAPTFSSMVNVFYIGIDKGTANELPTAANRLNNLTVATTNGASAGQGTVNVAVPTTVNGTLTVNNGQALLINGVTVTMNGASIVGTGDIANTGGGLLALNAATGTAVTLSGWLPNIQVNASSVGNTIVGSKGLVSGLLGVDNLRGGGDDFNPATTVANGSISYAGGAASSLAVSFGSGGLNGSQVGAITTAAGATLTLTTNLVSTGTVTHAAGTIAIPSGVNWSYMGTTFNTTGGATPAVINGAGTLTFFQLTGAGISAALNVGTGAGSIDVTNFVVNLGGSGDALSVNTNVLTLSGNVTVTRGTLTLNANVTHSGNKLTFAANGNVAGAGILNLNAATPADTVSYTGSPSITNLTISNDVVLTGAGTSLTVTGAFVHAAGNLNFGGQTITINGTYSRTGAGTYTATSGYLVIAGGSFAKGTTSFTIPNLRIASAGSFAFGGAGVVTVTKAFDLAETGGGVVTQQVSSTNTLTIDTTVTVTYVSGDLDKAPTYNGSIKLVLANTASLTITANIWTAGVPVTDLTVNCGANTATIPGNRTVSTNFNLTGGTLALTTNTLTTGNGANITVVSGLLTAGTGGFAPGNGNNITYNLASAAAYGTSIELPGSVNNFSLGMSAAANFNGLLTVNRTVTVAGTLTIANNIMMGVNGLLRASGNVAISDQTGANATATTLDFATNPNPLTFIGTTQTLALGTNRTIANINMNQTGATASVAVTGGNLTVTSIAFNNGLLVIGNNNLILPTVVQGFTHNSVGNLSHVVGNIQKNLAGGATGRFEFPVGTMTAYRPVAFTFGSPTSAAVITATNLVVSADSTNPGGTNGFPLTISGITVDTTANFSWTITSSISLGPSQTFDVEFQGTGFSNYSNVADIREIARLGNVITNPWVPQTGIYSNFEAPAGLPFVRVTGSTGNIIAQGAKFTFGFKKPFSGSSISGKVVYGTGSTAIKNVKVTLNPGNVTVAADTLGNYAFNNVANGTYTLSATTTNAWLINAVNNTDALLASNYYNSGTGLTGLKLTAADVNASGSVNNTDALLIIRRWAGLTNSFAAGNWVFSSQSVTVNSANITQNISGLAVGDVNGSGNPNLPKLAPSVALVSSGSLKVNAKDAFEVPVNASGDMSLGAVSLKLSYPKDLVTFEGVSSKVNLVTNDQDGKIYIAYADLSGGKEPLSAKNGESLFTLKFKPTANFKTGSQFSVSLDNDGSELAKEDGTVLNNANLDIASVEATVPQSFALRQNYPNPFNPTTTIEYDLPNAGSVKLTIYNTLGQQVTTLVNQTQSAGSYKIVWNANNVASGVYFYRISVESGSQQFTQLHKMILLK